MKKTLLSLIFFLSAFALNAQTLDDLIELLKSDIKTNRKALVTEIMAFSDSESTVFWPIYREFEFQLEALADKRIAIIKEFGANYSSLTNEKATQLMKSYFDFLEDRLSLNREYYEKFAEALNPTDAAKYMQLENEFQLLIDLQVAATLPYFKKPETGKK
jgi:hypothetical protein